MRGFWMGAVGLVAVLSLAGCGGPGPVDEGSEARLGETEQALACDADGRCDGGLTCTNEGLCRDCNITPQFCP